MAGTSPLTASAIFRIVRLVNLFEVIPVEQMSSEVPCTLHKNINTVAMLMGDALLHHFRKGMYHCGDRRLHTLISYVLLILAIESCALNPLRALGYYLALHHRKKQLVRSLSLLVSTKGGVTICRKELQHNRF